MRRCETIDWLIISKFNGTSRPKVLYSAKTGDNDCNVNSSRYSLRTALCGSIRYQAKSEQNVRQDLIPRVRHGEAALMLPARLSNQIGMTHLLPAACTWKMFYNMHHNDIYVDMVLVLTSNARYNARG